MPRAAAQRRADVPLNTLGGRIRKARLEAGLSLAAVVQKDFSRAFLNQVELGRSRPSPRTLAVIAERLSRPVEYFLQDEAEHVRAVQAEYVLNEAELELLKRDPRSALRLLDARVVANMARPKRMKGLLLTAEALVQQMRGAEALEVLVEALPYFERVGSPTEHVRALDALGAAYWASHRLDEALSTYDQARVVYEQTRLQEPDLLATILGHVAAIHQETGRHDEAIAAYDAALSATERLRDLPRRGVIYEGLARSYHQGGDDVAALEYIRKALRIFEQLQQTRMTARLQHNMADILVSLNRPAEAEVLYRQAIATARRAEAAVLLPLSLAMLAEVVLRRGAIDEASKLAEEAVQEGRRLNQPGLLAGALRVTAHVWHARGNWAASDLAFEEAFAAYQEGARYEYLAQAHSEYAACLRERGELARAAEHFERAYQVRSSGGRMKGVAKASQAL
jgi:tetratricopeptide (TPR) repeat protein